VNCGTIVAGHGNKLMQARDTKDMRHRARQTGHKGDRLR